VVSPGLYPLAAITGPTGAGKSSLALAVAEVFPAEILNCDSLQLYQGLNIGTAKPSLRDRARVPHHLLDCLRPEEVFSAGEYAGHARSTLARIAARSNLPLVTGGTGFYLRALLDGLAPGPLRDGRLREDLARRERRRPGCLHRLLSRLDPANGAHIHPRDIQKLIRYLEIARVSRLSPSQVFSSGRTPLHGFAILRIMLHPPRAALCERIRARTRAMFEAGLVEEVRGLLDSGVPRHAKAFESIGYKESLAIIDGRMTTAEAILAAEIATRQYAKRQVTWFKREANGLVLPGFGDSPHSFSAARAALERHLADYPLPASRSVGN
jgi:tRNA dimethylallyltransferase